MRTEGKYILDENGEPIPCYDLTTWANAFEKDTRRILKQTEISKDIRVSTVFLGMDHSFSKGPPLLWETMIFGGKHDSWQNRYATKLEALIGHDAAVELAKTEKP